MRCLPKRGGSFLTAGNGIQAVPLDACILGQPCPTGVLNGSYTKTGRLFAGLRLRPLRHHALEVGYSFSPNRLKVFDSGNPSQDIGPGYNRVSFFNVNYVGYLIARGPIQPYYTVGIGTNSISQAVHSNGTQLGYNYGGGVDLVPLRHFALRVELRDFMTSQPAPLRGTVHNIVPSAGIVFRFL